MQLFTWYFLCWACPCHFVTEKEDEMKDLCPDWDAWEQHGVLEHWAVPAYPTAEWLAGGLRGMHGATECVTHVSPRRTSQIRLCDPPWLFHVCLTSCQDALSSLSPASLEYLPGSSLEYLQRRWWSLLLWRYSRSAWTRSSAAFCSWPRFWQGVGLGDPQRSLPTPNTLWFCDSPREDIKVVKEQNMNSQLIKSADAEKVRGVAGESWLSQAVTKGNCGIWTLCREFNPNLKGKYELPVLWVLN